MFFFVMVISMLIGIFLIAFGISHRKSKFWYKISIEYAILNMTNKACNISFRKV
ncbi:hypothetical protein FACS1894111_04600 [Clostridia bacterium]|nr:hypothetical protein FACS1894111_04600 [Clostridia bacterium]